jgi:hypothetical protein
MVAIPLSDEISTIDVNSYRELTQKYRGQRKIIEIYLEDLYSEDNFTFYAWKDEKFAKELLKSVTIVK